jgi:flagellar motility protein MotE (MotC chaperone)
MLMMGMLALIFFAGGLSASWWLAQQRKIAQQASEASHSQAETVVQHLPSRPASATSTSTHDVSTEQVELPTALRPDAALSPEEAFKFGEMFNKQKQRLEQERSALARQRQRIEYVQKEIQSTRREIEGLQIQVDQAIERAELLVQDAAARQQKLLEQEQASQATDPQEPAGANAAAGDDLAEIKKFAEFVQGMKSQDAAAIIKNLGNSGRIDRAAQILQQLEDRNAAKILSELDPELSIQIADAFRPKPPTSAQSK